MKTIYQELSEERKKLQDEGLLPDWFTTTGWQLFSTKYLTDKEKNFKDVATRISKSAARWTNDPPAWESKFFEAIWNGWLSCSTPVLSNMGTDRGCSVSCSGSSLNDSVYSFYDVQKETAMLSKNGFGTSAYLGNIRPRGTLISSNGGKASGVLPVLKDFIQLSRDISQGCYDDTTEILTERGWVLFDDLIEQHNSGIDIKVAYVLDDGSIDFCIPSDYIKYFHNGNMVSFKDSKNIDMLVTPNHNMVSFSRKRYTNKRNEFGNLLDNSKYIDSSPVLDTAEEIKLHRDKLFMHSGYTKSGEDISMLDRLYIAFQADGAKVKNSKYAIRFRFTKERKINRLEWILSELGLEYSRNKDKNGVINFYIKTPNLEVPKTLEWVGDLQARSLEWCYSFIEEVLLWDGDQKRTYSSIIEENVDVIQSIAAMCGYKSRKRIRERDYTRKTIYSVVLSEGVHFGTESIHKGLVDYSGYVYCITVPSNKIIVRSNGHTLVCGNSQRRGAWAGYIEIDHKDFWEIANFVYNNPDDCNIGWNISDEFIKKLDAGDAKAIARYQKAMKVKMVTGKGYFFFPDKVNALNPQVYKDKGLSVKASNLCAEISLFSDENHTFTCVLSSLNLAKYDEWKNTSTIFDATVFLDCVASEFISMGSKIRGLEKAVRFTEKGRALGLGVMGFHTYLQQKMIPFESLDAHFENINIFKDIDDKSLEASKWMAKEFGEPEWCKGYGIRNTHRICCPPTLSTANIVGGVSQGIEPIYKNVYVQGSAAGEMNRINPVFLDLMKEKGKYTEDTITDIINHGGSVQHLSWLDEHEKKVFKTAFEIDQKVVIRLAAIRQKYVDQAQSINLFFSADESEEYISEVHQMAFKDPYIKSLYYIRSEAGVQSSKGECESCSG